jgi:hypothetical protein
MKLCTVIATLVLSLCLVQSVKADLQVDAANAIATAQTAKTNALLEKDQYEIDIDDLFQNHYGSYFQGWSTWESLMLVLENVTPLVGNNTATQDQINFYNLMTSAKNHATSATTLAGTAQGTFNGADAVLTQAIADNTAGGYQGWGQAISLAGSAAASFRVANTKWFDADLEAIYAQGNANSACAISGWINW